MPERIITVKKSGPSKHNPEKYGWVLDANTDKLFVNVTRTQADAAMVGTQYKHVYHINPKGYEETDSWTPLNGTTGHNHLPANGHSKDRFIFMCGIVNRAVQAGKIPINSEAIALAIQEIYRGYDQAHTE